MYAKAGINQTAPAADKKGNDYSINVVRTVSIFLVVFLTFGIL